MTRMPRAYIVGAGLFGLTCAQELARRLGFPITVVEKRKHIGGNCWSEVDAETGIECHKYGTHIFHTSNERVWNFISRFTGWNNYQHHVLTKHDGATYQLPINLDTINRFYHEDLDPAGAQKFLEAKAQHKEAPDNFEDKAISLIGPELYGAFIRGYTRKQWQRDPRELPAHLLTRIPLRFNYNSRYFSDTWEGLPLDGYGKMFARMAEGLDVVTGVDWKDFRDAVEPGSLVIYTGPIDEYYDFRLGRLDWRSVGFEAERHPVPDYQGTSVMNYADEKVPYTRIHEFRHLHPERHYGDRTIIYKEYSRTAGMDDERFYPVPTAANKQLYAQYQELAAREAPVYFGGRLGTYAYLDMDDALEAALLLTDRVCAEFKGC